MKRGFGLEIGAVASGRGSVIQSSMARMIVGSRGQPLAVAQVRPLLAELASEWPNVTFVQRSVAAQGEGDGLLAALERGQVQIALLDLAQLPLTLPEGLELAAVTRRLEPRCSLIAKGQRRLSELEAGGRVGVGSARDAAFLRSAKPDLAPTVLSDPIEDGLALLVAGEIAALVVPAAHLQQLGRHQPGEVLLEAELLPPAAGQGSLGLIVRADDDLANELAYTLQHRPSFARVEAERSFALALGAQPEYAVGALATLGPDGELSLFGALAHRRSPLAIQAEIAGEAGEAAALGRELAQDVLEQLKQRA